MAHVIVTALSLGWVLLTITVTLAVFSGLLTPQWLQGSKPLTYGKFNDLYLFGKNSS